MTEITIGNRQLKVKQLGAIQLMDISATLSRKRYMDDAREIAKDLTGKDKAIFLNEALKEASRLDDQSLAAMATVGGQIALFAKATGLKEAEAAKAYEEATADEQEEIMKAMSPEGAEEGDEDEQALRGAVENVVAARYSGSQEALEEAVKVCSDSLRSVAKLVESGNA